MARWYIFYIKLGLGKATPQQDSAQDKMSTLAKFGPAVESCSKPHHLYQHIRHALFIDCIIALLLQIEKEIIFAKFAAICSLIILALYAYSQV